MKKLSLLFVFSFVAMSMFAQLTWVPTWINLNKEPDYAANPYTKAVQKAMMAPAAWEYAGITDAASFDDTWNILGDSAAVKNLTSNGVAGDLFDLGEASPSFGAAWKAVYDEENLYILLKYWDLAAQVDAGTHKFEIMAQPHPDTDPMTGHYNAIFDTATDFTWKQRSYVRWTVLGGGKVEYDASGTKDYNAMNATGGWASYEPALIGLAGSTHFWDDDGAGLIRAILVMDYAGTLSYYADPEDAATIASIDPTATEGNDTIQFDIKSYAAAGGTADDNKVEYFWSADDNNGYASNYYSGMLVFEAPAALSSDTTLSDLTYDGTTVEGFASGTAAYNVELPAGTTTVPTVVATPTDPGATVEVTDAADVNGATSIVVTAEDGTIGTYVINFSVSTSVDAFMRNNIKVFVHNDILTIKGSKAVDVEIYSITGYRVKVAAKTNEVSMHDLNDGVYIVRLNGASVAYKVVK